ncbi:hypothetical protein MRX96_015731 [Rhipicephalus microplus]
MESLSPEVCATWSGLGGTSHSLSRPHALRAVHARCIVSAVSLRRVQRAARDMRVTSYRRDPPSPQPVGVEAMRPSSIRGRRMEARGGHIATRASDVAKRKVLAVLRQSPL